MDVGPSGLVFESKVSDWREKNEYQRQAMDSLIWKKEFASIHRAFQRALTMTLLMDAFLSYSRSLLSNSSGRTCHEMHKLLKKEEALKNIEVAKKFNKNPKALTRVTTLTCWNVKQRDTDVMECQTAKSKGKHKVGNV
eukprot:3820906-Amphidinium_carterae.1